LLTKTSYFTDFLTCLVNLYVCECILNISRWILQLECCFQGVGTGYRGVGPGVTRSADHLSSKSRLLVTFSFLSIKHCCLEYLFSVLNRMAPRKTSFEKSMAEFIKRKSVVKSREVDKRVLKEKAVNFLAENSVKVRDVQVSARYVASKSQAVESMSVDLTRQEELLAAESVEQQILRIIGEISDDEEVIEKHPLTKSNNKRFSRKVTAPIQFMSSECPEKESVGLGDEVFDGKVDSSSTLVQKCQFSVDPRLNRSSGQKYGGGKDKNVEWHSADFQLNWAEIDATIKSGFPHEWRLIRMPSGELPSGALYENIFTVDPFQLNDFETVWNSFSSSEVSSRITDYRPNHRQGR
jgi:hypothetical protein